MSIYLHSIVEVDKTKKIRCMAPECKKTVYKQIHVLFENGEILLYGSGCYKKTFGHTELGRQKARFQIGSASRLLTEYEREQLLKNTRALLLKLEKEYKLDLEKTLVEVDFQPTENLKSKSDKQKNRVNYVSREDISPEIWGEAKARVRQKYNIDPELPGWYGLIKYEAYELLESSYENK